MDNFRKINSNKRGRAASMDGFRPAGQGSQQSSAPGVKKPGLQQGGRVIGDFKSQEGFYPVSRPTEATRQRPMGRQPRRDAHGKIQMELPEGAPRRQHKGFSFRPKRKKILLTAAIMFLIPTMIGGFLFGKGILNARKIFKGGGGAAALQENVDPSKLNGEGDGRVNILLLGKGGVGHEGADLTDTILVASINPVQKEAALLSIPRDLYVKTGTGGYSKINAIYANAKSQAKSNRKSTEEAEQAGFKAIEGIIESKIGIPIHYHAMVDFEGFKKAIDAVGGVTIDVPEELTVQERMYLEGRSYYLNVKEGQQEFDGFRALAFARTRQTSKRGDFDRAERQRLVIVALKNKVLSAGTFGNPSKISQLTSAFGNHVQTNLTVGDMSRLYEIGRDIDSSKIASIGLADPPNNYITTSMMNGLSVVIPRAGVDDYSEIKNFIRNKLRDGYLADENSEIIILNGTTTGGLATRTSNELKSYGYNVSKIGDAPTQSYSKTVIVDLKKGQSKYTKNYLEKRFGVTTTSTLPDSSIVPGSADFVIILGTNEVSRLQQ